MTREGKTLLLLTLTYVLYAMSILLSQGSFIFPFPLNGFALFVITVQLAWWNKSDLLPAITVGLIGLSSLISSPPFWEIWLNSEALIKLDEINFYPIAFLTHSILTLVYLSLSTLKFKNSTLTWISLVAGAGILGGGLFASHLSLALSFLLIAGSLLLKRKLEGLNWIWAFMFFFNLIDLFTLGM